MERDSFVFYRSFSEGIRKIRKPADRLKAYEAIIDFGLDGRDPTDLSEGAEVAFILAKAQLEANNKRYLDGTKGGRPKKPVVLKEETSGFEDENHRIQNAKPNVNVNVNENENVNVTPISTNLADYVEGIARKRRELERDESTG